MAISALSFFMYTRPPSLGSLASRRMMRWFSGCYCSARLVPLFIYIFIVLLAYDNGEGGTFALYSLLCRHARLCILPNQHAADENLSSYNTKGAVDSWQSSMLKDYFNRHPRFQTALLIVVLLGTCMAIGNGVLTPTISDYVMAISCLTLIALFSLQHHDIHRVAFIWHLLLCHG